MERMIRSPGVSGVQVSRSPSGGTDDPEPARCRSEWRVTGTQPTGQSLEAARHTNENELEGANFGEGSELDLPSPKELVWSVPMFNSGTMWQQGVTAGQGQWQPRDTL